MNEPWFVRTILLKFKLVYSHVSTNRGVHTFFSKMKKKKKFLTETESGTITLST